MQISDRFYEAGSDATQPFGVTDQQRNDAYTQWLQAGLSNGLQGMLQYQAWIFLRFYFFIFLTLDALI